MSLRTCKTLAASARLLLLGLAADAPSLTVEPKITVTEANIFTT
jgi:hypothetical protein